MRIARSRSADHSGGTSPFGEVSKLFVDTQRGTITRVPWSALQVQRDLQKIVLTMQQDTLPQAPQQQEEQGKESQGNGGSPSASPRGDQKR